jgi:predicted phage terminase large subunit-like protein
VEELRAIQARNPSMFMALHQQKPVADEGSSFKRGWLRPYGSEELPKKLSLYLSTDFAMTTGSGDYTVLVVAGVCADGFVWLLDLWREQCSMLAGVERAVEMMRQWKVGKYLIERTGMARAYGPVLAKRRGELGVWAVEEAVQVIGRGSKDIAERAGALAGAMQLGYVRVPVHAPWLGELEYELTRFPNGRYDDQVDALTLLGLQLQTLRKAGRVKGEQPEGPVQLKPVSYTFDQAREMNRRSRMGLRCRPRAMVLPFPGKTVLDAA